MDRGAWQTIVYGVAQLDTTERLSIAIKQEWPTIHSACLYKHNKTWCIVSVSQRFQGGIGLLQDTLAGTAEEPHVEGEGRRDAGDGEGKQGGKQGGWRGREISLLK